MSAMSFDFSGRRLLIGGQDGRLSMWNFNNGQQLKEFRGFGQNEVSCVACLEEGKVKFVGAGGWNGKVCIWGDGVKEREMVEHVTRGHSDDIICMAVFPPNCFATGSYDGKVIVWKVDGVIRCVLQASDIHSNENICNPITSLLTLPMVYEASLGHVAQPGPMCVDFKNQILFTSDIKGYVKAWTMKELIFSKESVDSKFSELFCFRAHHGTIVSMIFIEEKKLILTASIFFACRLWTDTGIKIGQFGQSNTWNLQVPETWAKKNPSYIANIPQAQDFDSISSSTRSSSRISTSASSGRCSSNSRQTSRGSGSSAPQVITSENEEIGDENRDTSLKCQSFRYPDSKIANIIEGGPPHLRLESWYRPLQMAYNRKLPTKELMPFGPIIPSDISFVKKKQETTLEKASSVQSRRKSRNQESPPRLSLPRFRLNHTAQTFSTLKSDTCSPRSMASFGLQRDTW